MGALAVTGTTSESARQRAVGDLGEDLVVAWERARLREAGRPDLADRVERVSVTQGDGLGFDVRSFDDVTGTEMHIEVKATTGGVRQPFPISAAEVAYSETASDVFWLYRVFDVEASPSAYRLRGCIKDHFTLDPVVYLARR